MDIIAIIVLGLLATIAHFRISSLAEKVRRHEASQSGRLDSVRRKLTERTDQLNSRITSESKHMHEHFDSVSRRAKNINEKTFYLLTALSDLADKLGYKVSQEDVDEQVLEKDTVEEVKKMLPPFLRKMIDENPHAVPIMVAKPKNHVSPLIVTKKKPAPRRRR